MTNNYLVKLTLRLGEFEKRTCHYVKDVDDREEAVTRALEGECHADDVNVKEGYAEDDANGFTYHLHSCQQLTEEQSAVLDELNI